MFDLPSREGFAALTQAAHAIARAVALGFARGVGDGSMSIVYSYPPD
jgi:hypothetical protein